MKHESEEMFVYLEAVVDQEQFHLDMMNIQIPSCTVADVERWTIRCEIMKVGGTAMDDGV